MSSPAFTSPGFWVTPLSVAILLASALHGLQPHLPHPALVQGVAGLGGLWVLWGLWRGPAWARWCAGLAPGRWRWRQWVGCCLVACVHPAPGVGAWAWSWANARALAQAEQQLAPEVQGHRLWVQGQVISLPQASPWGWRFMLAPHSAHRLDGGPGVQLPPRLWVTMTNAPRDDAPVSPPRVGEVWAWPLRVQSPHGVFNPLGDDVQLRAWANEVGGWARVSARRHDPMPQRLAPAGTWHAAEWTVQARVWLERWREGLRDRWQSEVPATALTSPSVGVALALLMGDQAAIGVSDWQLFRATGVAHLMSISGLHITAWAALCMWGVRAWWRWADGQGWGWSLRWPAPLAAWTLGTGAALAYALFSGWGLPAQRTVLMLGLVVALRWRGWRWPGLSLWLSVAAVVCVWQPLALWQPGFWLSFVAVGVLMAERQGAPARGLWAGLGRLLLTQGRLSLALLPLTWWWFGQVSWVGVAVNLWAIPWVTWVVLPVCVIATMWPPAMAWALLSLDGLRVGLAAMAAWPWAVSHWPALPLGAFACLMLGTAWALWPGWPARWRAGGWVGGWVLAGVIWFWHERGSPVPWGQVRVLVVDVGQGLAVVLRTQHQTWLYDAGPGQADGWNAGERVLLPLLRALGWQPDGLVLSHRDADHVGGALSLLEAYPGLSWLGSVGADHPLAWQHPGRLCAQGQRWWVDGVRFEVLHPRQFQPRGPSNRQSCVVRVVAQGGEVMLTGDLEARDEAALVAQGLPLRAQVLVVSHHGSRGGSSPEWLAAVDPDWALISAGHLNPHGHPHPEVLARLQAQGAQVRNTAECGALHWTSGQAGVRCERELRPRFWHHPQLIALPTPGG